MDPNTALVEMREHAGVCQTAKDGSDEEYDAMVALAEKFEALDEWLSKGGFLPTAWQPKPEVTKVTPEAPTGWCCYVNWNNFGREGAHDPGCTRADKKEI